MADEWGIYGPRASIAWQPVFPPLPAVIVMEDRDTGVLWQLTHTADGENIMITDEFRAPRYGNAVDLGVDGGPYLFYPPNTHLRLFVRGGHLGWEELSSPYNGPLVLTRRGMARVFKHVYIPATFFADGHIGWGDWV